MKRNTAIRYLGTGAAVLALTAFSATAAVMASDGFDPLDGTLTVENHTYSFPSTVDELKEAGLKIDAPLLGNTVSGYFYLVNAEDGETSFTVRVERIKNVLYATGYDIEASDGSGIIAGGIALDDISTKELTGQLEDLAEESGYENIDVYDTSITVYTMEHNRTWDIDLDGNKVTGISYHDELLKEYGMEFSDSTAASSESPAEIAGEAYNEFILNDAYYGVDATIQDLFDHGWRATEKDMETLKGKTMQPQYSTVSGFYLYNGEGMILVRPYNSGAQTIAMKDCNIGSIEVRKEWNSALTMVDGLTIGSTLDEFSAVLGEASDTSFTVLDGVRINLGCTDDKEKTVWKIEIRNH
ncbi:MAG: hypothetical protein Q4B09_01900 [Lachnospiraceae bacterium]|nr:hypothetical protein [Lachnospiraceae bacterium]